MAIGFAGTSIADIEQGAEDALEEDISNMSPASNSVAGNLDGGVAAVDWTSKTPKSDGGILVNAGPNEDIISVNGSGYLIGCQIKGDNGIDEFRIDIDGVTIDSGTMRDRGAPIVNSFNTIYFSLSLFHRFNTGFAIGTGSNTGGNENISATISYVLD